MTETESFKFIIQVDVRYLSDPPRLAYSAPTLEQVEKALLEKLQDLDVEDWPADVHMLARTQVIKESEKEGGQKKTPKG